MFSFSLTRTASLYLVVELTPDRNSKFNMLGATLNGFDGLFVFMLFCSFSQPVSVCVCVLPKVLRSSGSLSALKAVLLSSIKYDILKEAQKRFKGDKNQANTPNGKLQLNRIAAAQGRERCSRTLL